MSRNFELKRINLTLSPSVARRIASFLDHAGVSDPVPALLLARDPDEPEERLRIGAYSRGRAEELHELYRSHGLHALVQADSLQLCVPQTHLHARLENKMLDLQNDTLVLRDL